MPIIGRNTIGALNTQPPTFRAHGLITSANTYTAVPGDAITRYYVYAASLAPGVTFARAAVYTVAGTLPSARLHTPERITILPGAPQWWLGRPVNYPLTPGQTYCIAWIWPLNVNFYYDTVANIISRHDVFILEPVWLPTSYDNDHWSVYAEVTTTPPGPPFRRFPCCAQEPTYCKT